MEASDSIAPKRPAWLALLKIGKVTFWFIWVTPMVFGYIASAHAEGRAKHVFWFVLSVIGTFTIETINCLHNELVDQEEDAANQPRRTELLATVGERRGWRLVVFGYAFLTLALVPMAIFAGVTPAVLIFLGCLAAPLYNWGPRLKRRPYLAELAIGWAVFFVYLVGWSLNSSIWDVSPVIWILTYFFAVTSLVKDLPDVKGDELVGAGGVFSIRRKSLRTAMLLFIYVSPYVLVGTLVATDAVPARVLWTLVLLPVGLWVMAVGERVSSLSSLIAAYELAFLYVHAFFLVLFVAATPTTAAFVAAGILLVVRLAALGLGLAPRFVEPGFSFRGALRELRTS